MNAQHIISQLKTKTTSHKCHTPDAQQQWDNAIDQSDDWLQHSNGTKHMTGTDNQAKKNWQQADNIQNMEIIGCSKRTRLARMGLSIRGLNFKEMEKPTRALLESLQNLLVKPKMDIGTD